MKGNHVAQYMNTVNRNSVHKSIKDLLEDDPSYWIDEGIKEYNQNKEEIDAKSDQTPR